MGKVLGLAILLSALVAGVSLYYLQIYAFYEEVPATGPEDVQLTRRASGEVEPIPHAEFRAIDADSSPIRYRACFTTDLDHARLTETYATHDKAVPLEAPKWFDCFDADAIGAALEEGRALAFMGQENIEYGIDRIVAVFNDGRGYVWHQINHCGEVVFDGQPAPEDCPEPPSEY